MRLEGDQDALAVRRLGPPGDLLQHRLVPQVHTVE
jgi:hypothetical protein